jgi:hypothetical protein
VSNIGFAVAGAGAALALVTLIVGHEVPSETPAEPPAEKRAEKPAEQGLRWVPWIGAGAAGVSGTF